MPDEEYEGGNNAPKTYRFIGSIIKERSEIKDGQFKIQNSLS